MNEYKITVQTKYKTYQLTRNAETKAEALESVMEVFDYSSISEYDEELELSIVVTKM